MKVGTMVNGKTICDMVKERCSGLIAQYTSDSGLMTKCTARALTPGRTVAAMKANGGTADVVALE